MHATCQGDWRLRNALSIRSLSLRRIGNTSNFRAPKVTAAEALNKASTASHLVHGSFKQHKPLVRRQTDLRTGVDANSSFGAPAVALMPNQWGILLYPFNARCVEFLGLQIAQAGNP